MTVVGVRSCHIVVSLIVVNKRKMSFESKTKTLKSNENNSIDLISIPNLNLYIISDINNLGSDWIQVLYCRQKQIYSTKTLLGTQEDSLAPVCRYLAENIIKNKSFNDQNLGNDEQICLTFNISLKNTDINDIKVIQNIGHNLSK